MEDQVRLSNPENGVRTAGQQGCGVGIRSPLEGVKAGSEAWTRLWLEQRGRLSNPQSDLNQAVDLLVAGLQAIGYEFGITPPPPSAGKRRRVRWLSAAEVDELVKLYRAGSSAQELARQFVISRTTVLGHLKRRKVPTRVNKRKMNDEQAQEMRQLHDIGVSYHALARTYGVSVRTVKREIVGT